MLLQLLLLAVLLALLGLLQLGVLQVLLLVVHVVVAVIHHGLGFLAGVQVEEFIGDIVVFRGRLVDLVDELLVVVVQEVVVLEIVVVGLLRGHSIQLEVVV